MITKDHDIEFYREQTIKMLQDVKRPDILIYIYKLTKDIIHEDSNN